MSGEPASEPLTRPSGRKILFGSDGLAGDVVWSVLLPTVGNLAYPGNMLVTAVVAALAGKLPRGWQTAIAAPLRRDRPPAGPAGMVDAIVTIRRPGAPAGRLFIEAKARLEPKDVDYLAATLRPTADRTVLVAIGPRESRQARSAPPKA